ncbi:MAG: superoxide dismutase [Planctomycetota bacterium]
MAFTLPDLPYAYDALEPAIDAKTMEIHYSKHHGAYASKLTAAVEGTPFADQDIADILKNLGDVPADKQGAVRNNGGGYFNHNLFWSVMTPGGKAVSGDLAAAIDADLGGFDKFKSAFSDAAATRFGSGWAWLCVDTSGKLHVTSTANQDVTFMPEAFGGHGDGHTPILGLDVWEHAYYLNYQNRRPDYIEAFFGVINWDAVAERYAAAKG